MVTSSFVTLCYFHIAGGIPEKHPEKCNECNATKNGLYTTVKAVFISSQNFRCNGS